MSTAGKHAVIGIFYTPPIDKAYVVKVLEVAKTKNGGFGKHRFFDADTFLGHADPKIDAIIVEGTVAEATRDKIVAAYAAIGKESKVLSGTLKEEFEQFEKDAGIVGGVTSDPPANATDNVTASRNSPQAHVETDGRNDPRPWQHTTGTSFDAFGLPLATTDRTGISAAEAVNGLDAQGQAVSARTAAAAAGEMDRADDAAGNSERAIKAAQAGREKAAEEEAAAKQKAADEAEASQKAADEAKAKADAENASNDEAKKKAEADKAKAAAAKGK